MFTNKKINKNNVCTVLWATYLLLSCTKESVPPASYQNGVYFYLPADRGNVVDIPINFKTNYTFYYANDPLASEDTFWLPDVRVLGNVANRDRNIRLSAVDSLSTAIAGTHYRLLNKYIMPAGQFSTKLGVVLLKSLDLNNASTTLSLELQPSEDFPAVMKRDTIVGIPPIAYFEGTHYTIVFTNKASAPPYWNDVMISFGSWSKVKYEFIYQVTGKKLGLKANNVEEQANLFSYYLQVKAALNEYNATHSTPLTDESGMQIYIW
ncbi:DUF4843 domain-containing protein [Niabella sp. CJ426]|uniref:DUF4843 domain-containing protein n=1 Tax=Niabella sp. CJ426 TaxID=3393740 RepID=UPI003CFD11EB